MGYLANRYGLEHAVRYGGAPHPSTTGTAMPTNVTRVMLPALPVDSWITQIEHYSSSAGEVKFKILQPVTNGGFNVVSSTTKTAVIGLNVFSDIIFVPANSMLGAYNAAGQGRFYVDQTQEVFEGYISFAADVSGSNVQPTSIVNYGNRINVRQKRIHNPTASPPAYIINEDFLGTTCPTYVINGTTPWTFEAGKAISGGTGIANGMHWVQTLNADRNTWEVDFEFTAATDRIGIMRHPVLNFGSVDDGTIIELNCATNSIVIYAQLGTSNNLPSVYATVPITELTLAADTRYRAKLYKNAHTLSITITDVVAGTSQTASITVTTGGSGEWGRCYGRPGVVALAGTVEVYRARFWADQTNPRIALFGDSILQGSGQTPAGQFAQLVLNQFGGRGWYSGDGGASADACLGRINNELRLILPEYVLVHIGTNNAPTDVDNWYIQIVQIYDRIVEAGCIPIMCAIIPRGDEHQHYITDFNNFMIAQGWRLIRADIALSVGGDGVTYDPAKYADSSHPNDTGAAAWFARAQLDYPEVFT